jgi:hypothetical protein
MSKSNGVAAGPPPTCQRCGDCRGAEHHWIDDFGLTDYACKHCPARGVMCPDCSGVGQLDDRYDLGCARCNLTGVVEVVEITAAEVAVLRRDQARLRTAAELWQITTGESLIAITDQIQATVISGLAAAGQKRCAAEQDTGEFDTSAIAAEVNDA